MLYFFKVYKQNSFIIFEKVKFDSKHGISLKTHQNYIQEFAETFYEQVKRLIDKNQEQKSEYSYLSEEDLKILQEVQDHANFCNETVEKFHGRSDLLDQVWLIFLFNLSHKTGL